jgi:molybdopterin-guanine dinucleotide biosynthesis protein A
MNVDKGLTLLKGEPIILHAKRRVAKVVDEVIIVVHTLEQQNSYRAVFNDDIVLDFNGEASPLLGAYTGLSQVHGSYTFMVGYDMPFIDSQVVERLFSLAEGNNAATPIWPNGYVEPLHAVYRSSIASEKAWQLLEKGEKRLRMILRELPQVATLQVEEIRKIDPNLFTLFDVDSPEDLKNAQKIMCS